MTEFWLKIDRTEKLLGRAQELDEKFRRDPHRPRYHFMAPRGWMNDINGTIFWNGRYHVFYQHLPWGGVLKAMRWGHASSVDLVHWVHHPIALTPSTDGYDRNGCWSGGAFVNHDGVPTIIYQGWPEGACIATSEDAMLTQWRKHPANPVVRVPELGAAGFGEYAVVDPPCLDPCAWTDGGVTYALMGNHVPAFGGDGTYLFRSENLIHWEFLGPFYKSNRKWTEPHEDCAVPDFFPLADRHMLLFASHSRGSQYYLGRLEDNRYIPQVHGRMCWPGGQLGGPRTLLDGKGRRIYFDWIPELRSDERQHASGWSGVMTLPRILSLGEDGALRIAPVPEIEMLRMEPPVRRDVRLGADSELVIDEVRGDCLELKVEMKPEGAQEFGVKLRCSPDGAEQTAVSFSAASGTLQVKVSQSTLDTDIRYTYYRSPESFEETREKNRIVGAQQAPFAQGDEETLTLHIFLDRSVLEVFANERQCITQRIYPTRPDSLDVRLFSIGGRTIFKAIEAWRMAPTHE